MPDGEIVPLNTHDLALCWVLDGNRLDLPDDLVEIGPDFSALGSLTTSSDDAASKTCIEKHDDYYKEPYDLVYASGGWKIDTATTIWDHFGLINGSNNIGQTSENFQSIRSCEMSPCQ